MTEDNLKCLVIDSGSYNCKIGITNEENPRLIEPFYYGQSKSSGIYFISNNK